MAEDSQAIGTDDVILRRRRTQVLDRLIGDAEPFVQIPEQLSRISESEATVLISGETGARHPLFGPPAGSRVRGGQLRSASRAPDRERGVRARARRLHRRAPRRRPAWSCTRRRRDALPGRGRVVVPREVRSRCCAFLQDLRYRPLGAAARGARERPDHRRDQRQPVGDGASPGSSGPTSTTGCRFCFLDSPPLRERKRRCGRARQSFRHVFGARYGRPPRRLAWESIAALDRLSLARHVRELENLVHRALLLTSASVVSVPQQLRWTTPPPPDAATRTPPASISA